MTVLKSLLFLLLVPGLLMGYFPYLISRTDSELFALGTLGFLAFPLWLIGGVSMLWCFWNFVVSGRGTPAPIDPPKELVAVGLYRFVRNPMYVAGLIALFAWIIWSPSLLLIGAFLFFSIATHTFVIFYEEPTLKKKFGSSYEEYLNKVPRWIPKIP